MSRLESGKLSWRWSWLALDVCPIEECSDNLCCPGLLHLYYLSNIHIVLLINHEHPTDHSYLHIILYFLLLQISLCIYFENIWHFLVNWLIYLKVFNTLSCFYSSIHDTELAVVDRNEPTMSLRRFCIVFKLKIWISNIQAFFVCLRNKIKYK